jgi:hypothetical protein
MVHMRSGNIYFLRRKLCDFPAGLRDPVPDFLPFLAACNLPRVHDSRMFLCFRERALYVGTDSVLCVPYRWKLG